MWTILSLQIIADLDISQTIYTDADVDGYGKIGVEEAIYILEKISGIRD